MESEATDGKNINSEAFEQFLIVCFRRHELCNGAYKCFTTIVLRINIISAMTTDCPLGVLTDVYLTAY